MSYSEAIAAGSARFPKPTDKTFQYGTAGVSSLSDTEILDAYLPYL